MLIKITCLLLARIYAVRRIQLLKWIGSYNRKSTNVVWILPYCSMSNVYDYTVKSNTLFHDIALISTIVSRKIDFRIVFGNYSPKAEDNVFFTISSFFTYKNDEEYTAKLISIVSTLKDKVSTTYPSLEEVKLWENKVWMHREFERLDIPHPKTLTVGDQNETKTPDFPFLIKEVHSCGSKGVFQIRNMAEYNFYWSNKRDKSPVLYQQLLNMRKDLRVICANGEIKSYYWRLNDSENWRPTSTSHGSRVDFEFFPEQWRDFITNQFRKMKCATGAFDIAWQDDNLDNLPFILEFSPFYMPNPVPPLAYSNKPYNKYKTSIFIKDAYYKKYIDMIFELKSSTLNHYFMMLSWPTHRG